MFRMLFLVLCLAVLVLTTPAAFAIGCGGEPNSGPCQADVVDPCPTYDSCTMYNGHGGYGGIPFQYVPAQCKLSSCWACTADDNVPRNRCVKVKSNGTCECSDVPVDGAGPGITTCGDMYGSCVYNGY